MSAVLNANCTCAAVSISKAIIFSKRGVLAVSAGVVGAVVFPAVFVDLLLSALFFAPLGLDGLLAAYANSSGVSDL